MEKCSPTESALHGSAQHTTANCVRFENACELNPMCVCPYLESKYAFSCKCNLLRAELLHIREHLVTTAADKTSVIPSSRSHQLFLTNIPKVHRGGAVE